MKVSENSVSAKASLPGLEIAPYALSSVAFPQFLTLRGLPGISSSPYKDTTNPIRLQTHPEDLI